MSKLKTRFGRTAVVAIAAAAMMATVGIPSANAAFDDSLCGANTAIDGVYARGCWLIAEDQSGDDSYRVPAIKMRVPTPLGGTWTSCTVKLAVFRKAASDSSYTRIQTGVGDCLDEITANNTTNTAFWLWDTRVITPNKACYYVMARWFGTYNGDPNTGMGPSGPFAYSITVCGNGTQLQLAPSADVPDLLETPTVVGAPIE